MAKKTPEGIVKDAVKALLKEYDIRPAKDAGTFDIANGWYHMPSGGEYGVTGLPDFEGHYKNFYFSVETKAPGKTPKGFQALQIEAITNSGGAVFVIDTVEGVGILKEYFTKLGVMEYILFNYCGSDPNCSMLPDNYLIKPSINKD